MPDRKKLRLPFQPSRAGWGGSSVSAKKGKSAILDDALPIQTADSPSRDANVAHFIETESGTWIWGGGDYGSVNRPGAPPINGCHTKPGSRSVGKESRGTF